MGDPLSSDLMAGGKTGWPLATDRIKATQASVKNHQSILQEEETKARSSSSRSTLVLFWINGFATVLIFLFHLISLESLFSITLSVVLTIYTFRKTEDSADWSGGIMDWILLSFATVTPMSASIGMAFTRREKALVHIATIRSFFFGLYQAHCAWDWGNLPTTGRFKSEVDWLEHSDSYLSEIVNINDELCRYLTLPSTSRARHRMMPGGKALAKGMRQVGDQLMESIMTRINRLSLHCEILKLEGLPGNEAARIRQWERDIVFQIEGLQMLKEYRTPQALRSLCRIFSVLLPPFYAPYYAQMARDLNSLGTAIAFSVLTSLALTALFESLSQMEDPFLAHLTLDGIDVPREVRDIPYARLLSQRNGVFFPTNGVSFDGRGSERLPPKEEADVMIPRIFTE
jgi:hypothetical protein